MGLESYIIFSADESDLFTMAPARVLMFHSTGTIFSKSWVINCNSQFRVGQTISCVILYLIQIPVLASFIREGAPGRTAALGVHGKRVNR